MNGWNRFLLIGLAMVLLTQAALAAAAPTGALKEESFASLGFTELKAEGVNQSNCGQVFFSGDAARLVAGSATYASLHLSVLPVVDQFEASVYFNRAEQPLAVLGDKQLAEDGWLQVKLPSAEFRQKNEIRVCLKTSYTVTKLALLPDSLLGTYSMPDLSHEDSFTLTPLEPQPTVGDEFEIQVVVRNYGSQDAFVDFSYRKAAVEGWQPEVVALKGTTEARQALVPKCRAYSEVGDCVNPGEREFVYTAKVLKATKLTLLPAVIEFTDGFGKKQLLESNRPSIEAVEPKVKIKPLLLSERELIKVGQEYQGRVALKNTSLGSVSHVKVSLKVDPGLTLIGNDLKEFEFIAPEGAAYFEVRLRAEEPGSYTLGCESVYQEQRLRFSECAPITIVVEKEDFNIAWAVALTLVGIAGLAYWHINRS